MQSLSSDEVEFLIRSNVGKDAIFRELSIKENTVLKQIINDAEIYLTKNIEYYWVEKGLAENYCLPDFEKAMVIYSEYYFETIALLNSVMFSKLTNSETKIDGVKRIILSLIAEFSIKYENVDNGIDCFIKSILNQKIFYNRPDVSTCFDKEYFDQFIFVSYYFGLLHEIGHVHYADRKNKSDDIYAVFVLDDKTILEVIIESLTVRNYSKEHINKVIENIEKSPNLKLDLLKEEIFSDIFCINRVFYYSSKFFDGASNSKFSWEDFIISVLQFMHISSVIELCRCYANKSEYLNNVYDWNNSDLLTADVVRREFAERYLINLLADTNLKFLEDDRAECSRYVRDIAKFIGLDSMKYFGVGLTQAYEDIKLNFSRKSLFHKWQLALQRDESNDVLTFYYAKEFCSLSNNFGCATPYLDRFQTFVDLKGKVDINELFTANNNIKKLGYYVPWISSSLENSIPSTFYVPTEGWNLVFLFMENGETLKKFISFFEDALPPGYTLSSELMYGEELRDFTDEISSQIPTGERFRVLIENSEDFNYHMEKLFEKH